MDLAGLFLPNVNFSKSDISTLSETLNSTTNSVTSNTISNTNASAASFQNMNVTFGPKSFTDCQGGLVLNQSAKVSATAISNMTVKENTDLITALTNAIAQKVKNKAEQQNSGFSLKSDLNFSTQVSKTTTKIQNIVKNQITNTVENLVSVQGDSNQNQTITFLGTLITGGQCTIGQDAIVTTFAKALTDNIIQNLVKDNIINEVSQDVTNSTDQKNKGINLGDLFGMLIPVLLIVGVIALIYFVGLSPKMIMGLGAVVAVIGIVLLVMGHTIGGVIGLIGGIAVAGYGFYSWKYGGGSSGGLGLSVLGPEGMVADAVISNVTNSIANAQQNAAQGGGGGYSQQGGGGYSQQSSAPQQSSSPSPAPQQGGTQRPGPRRGGMSPGGMSPPRRGFSAKRSPMRMGGRRR